MNRMTTLFCALIIAMSMPAAVFAMSHGSHGGQAADKTMEMDHKGHDMMNHGQEKAAEMKQHGDMSHDDHGKHMGHDKSAPDDGFAEVGKSAQHGVVATLKIKAYDEQTRATMAKMGMNATHHVMVFFADEKSGAEIADGKVALKIKGRDDGPAMLMQMGKGFGGDVSLKESGMYTFEIGTKLADGNKRQFEVSYHNH